MFMTGGVFDDPPTPDNVGPRQTETCYDQFPTFFIERNKGIFMAVFSCNKYLVQCFSFQPSSIKQ